MSQFLSPLAQRTRARAHFGVLIGALELLESAEISTRSAGIFALESLMRRDPNTRESVSEILAALVRRRAGGARSELGVAAHARVPGDVQAALTVLGRMKRAEKAAPLDLHGISLCGAFLPNARFVGALLYDCDLEGALLDGADLRGAWLWQTNLQRVNLDNADLRGADLSGARHLRREQIETAIRDEQTRLPKFEDDKSSARQLHWPTKRTEL